MDGGGIAQQVFKCVQEMDIDNRMTMYQHIVMSGGSSMYPGMPSRCAPRRREARTSSSSAEDRYRIGCN